MSVRLLAALTVLAVLVPLLVVGFGAEHAPAAAQTDAERELGEARAALQQLRRELDAAEQDARTRGDQLAEAEEQLDRLEAVVNDVAVQVERQRVLVRDAEADLSEAQIELAALEDQVVDRIARLFKQGPELAFETLLSASGADEAIARTELLERVILSDQIDLEVLDVYRVNVEVRREIVRTEQARLEVQLEEQEQFRDEAADLRSSRALVAAEARQRTAQLGAEHDDLEAEEGALVALIAQQREAERQREVERQREAEQREAARSAAEQREAARRQAAQREAERRQAAAARAPAPAPAARAAAPAPAPAAPAPSTSSGGYRWPMCARVTSEYGPRWGTLHRGIDLGAPAGTPIRSVAAGTVLFAGWQGGYGNMTLIDHGGVVSAYAHQSGFAVGQGARVSQGQVIGYVGMTGNTTGPHLHLEFRVGGSAVNPRQYLSGSSC